MCYFWCYQLEAVLLQYKLISCLPLEGGVCFDVHVNAYFFNGHRRFYPANRG